MLLLILLSLPGQALGQAVIADEVPYAPLDPPDLKATEAVSHLKAWVEGSPDVASLALTNLFNDVSALFDENKDSKVAKIELRNAWIQLSAYLKNSVRTQAISLRDWIHALDPDHDFAMTFAELHSLFIQRPQTAEWDALAYYIILKAVDANQDGLLQAEEMSQALSTRIGAEMLGAFLQLPPTADSPGIAPLAPIPANPVPPQPQPSFGYGQPQPANILQDPVNVRRDRDQTAFAYGQQLQRIPQPQPAPPLISQFQPPAVVFPQPQPAPPPPSPVGYGASRPIPPPPPPPQPRAVPQPSSAYGQPRPQPPSGLSAFADPNSIPERPQPPRVIDLSRYTPITDPIRPAQAPFQFGEAAITPFQAPISVPEEIRRLRRQIKADKTRAERQIRTLGAKLLSMLDVDGVGGPSVADLRTIHGRLVPYWERSLTPITGKRLVSLHRFLQIDFTKNGEIVVPELLTVLVDNPNSGNFDALVSALYYSIDTDKDGALSQAEFAVADPDIRELLQK